jgi:hypothetical protein
MHKPFDKDLFREFDGPGKLAVASHMSGMGHWVQIVKGYRVDLRSLTVVGDPPYQVGFHEVEVSTIWDGTPTYFRDTIWIPGRKRKYVIDPVQKPLWFWQVSGKTMTDAFCISSTKLNDSMIEERDTSKGKNPFYVIPASEWTYIKLLEGIE